MLISSVSIITTFALNFRTNSPPLVVTLIYTAFGVQEGDCIPDDEERKNLSGFIYNKLPGLVKEGKVKPNVITEWEGGLEKVPDAIEHLATEKVSGEKIVFSL